MAASSIHTQHSQAACDAGQVEIDQDVYARLLQTGQFDRMSLDTDEVRVGCCTLACAAHVVSRWKVTDLSNHTF